MPYTKELPEWNAGGIKPPQSKLDAGWQVDEKPPASWWNWYMYTAYQSLLELQQNAVHGEKLGAKSGVATLGSDGKLTAAQLPAIGSGQITDGSITNNDLATDVKVGSLASLTTTAKGSVTAAVNDVKSIIDNHLNDNTRHITGAERTTWNGGQLFPLTDSAGGTKASVSNLNTATATGVHLVGSNTTGAPSTGVGILYVWRRGTVHVFQEYWEVSSNNRHHRTSLDNGATWQSWQTVANTAVATTSTNGLMSSIDKTALDNAQKWKLTLDNGRTQATSNSDLNQTDNSGFYTVGSSTQNIPGQSSGFGTAAVVRRDDQTGYQTMVDSLNNMFYRSKWNNHLDWRRVTTDNILTNVMLGNKITAQSIANFINKIAGSTTANPHIAKASGSNSFTSLQTPPFAGTFSEINANGTAYPNISILDGTNYQTSINTSGAIAQHSFSFDLIAHVERTYGTIAGATTADKVAWLKANVTKINLRWTGFGASPNGNKASVSWWNIISSTWSSAAVHGASTPTTLNRDSSVPSLVDMNGLVHFLAYAGPSDGTTPSVINTDYVELQVEISTSFKDNMKPVWIDATLQNGWVVTTDTAQNPQYSIGTDGYVSLKGAIRLGTLPGICITLPAGYRPTKSTVVPVSGASGNLYRITVSTGGSVTVEQSIGSGGNALVYLDGIRFPTN